MAARRLFMIFVVVLFSLSLASQALSSVVGEEVKGTVTKIDGEKINIKDFMGVEKTVSPKNPEEIKNLKLGDRVMVKDGILTKEGGAGAPSPGPRY